MATTTTDAAGSDPIEQWLANGAGTEKMRLTSGGSLGIGTTSPGTKLEIYGTANADTIRLNGASGYTPGILFEAAGTAMGQIFCYSSGGTTGDMACYVGSGSSQLAWYAKANGNVGIGTTSPARLLHVNGIARYKVPAVQVSLSIGQSIPSNTETTIAWPTHNFDNDNLHSDSTNNSRLTASETGIWAIGCNIIWDVGTGSGSREVFIKKNGGGYIGKLFQLPTGISGMAISIIWSLSANDYVEITVIQTEAAAINVAATTTNFWMHKISD